MFALAVIIASGIAAQWLAWRIRLPSILLLLVVGFIVGPISGLINPDALVGDLLMPAVSLSVALILFEGGLSLKFSEIKTTGHVVRNLVTTGAIVTLIFTAVAAELFLGWGWGQAFLFGAILTVTGPTVIAPLLRHVKPSRQVSAVLKWEGIVIDPIGAMLALLVLEVVATGAGTPHLPISEILWVSAKVVIVGTALGLAAAGLLILLLRKFWIPDYLQNPVTLMLVVVGFAAAEGLQHESGLFAVTLMGIAMANQPWVKTGHILEFKENLRVLLISVLFVVLAARVDPEQVRTLPWAAAVGLLLTIVLIVRPLGVFLSTIGSALSLPERVFVAGIAPRGIVAAAVGSLFAERLASAGVAEATEMVPVIFFVIVGTVTIYGLGASPFARKLGVSIPDAQGCLIAGATPTVRKIAASLASEGFRTVVVDTNRQNILAAQLEGLETHYGSIVSGQLEEELELSGIGKLLALTPNSEINSLACLHSRHHFGTENTYQLAAHEDPEKREKAVASSLKSRVLFGEATTYRQIAEYTEKGAEVRTTGLTESFTFEDLLNQHDTETHPPLPLFLITPQKRLRVFAVDTDLSPGPGDRIISLVLSPSPFLQSV